MLPTSRFPIKRLRSVSRAFWIDGVCGYRIASGSSRAIVVRRAIVSRSPYNPLRYWR